MRRCSLLVVIVREVKSNLYDTDASGVREGVGGGWFVMVWRNRRGRVGARGIVRIELRTKDYGYRKHEREHENLVEQRSHFGVEAYRCNPRWGSRTHGPPLAPLRGTRPLLPKQETHHRSFTLKNFAFIFFLQCFTN